MKKIKFTIISLFYYLIFVFGYIFLYPCNSASAQINSYLVKEQFQLQELPKLSEQIYLHLDRKDYITGETIWFKAYDLLNNQFNKNNLSKIIYLELVDVNGVSVAKGKYQIENCCADGSIQIPESLLSGYYTLYAYTKWMRNLGNNFYCSKNIFIINPEKAIYTYQADSINDNNLILNFYPEGGRLVAGFENSIIFTAKTKNGEETEIEGQIVDKSNNIITEFKSGLNGLNQFIIVPKKDESYRAIIIRKDKSNQIFNLPKVDGSGLGINLDNDSGDFLKIQIESNENTPLINKTLKIEVESNGYIYKTIERLITNGKYSEFISKKDLIAGNNKIRIINSEGKKLYEKYFAFPTNDNLNVDINTDKNQYSRREKVNLIISTSAVDKSSETAQLSISVSKLKYDSICKTDKEFLNSNSHSEIKNYNRVAKSINDSTQIKKRIEFLPETSGLILSGSVKTKFSNQAANHVNIYLSSINNNKIVQNTLTNSEGKFYFNLDEIHGKSELVFQLADQSLFGQQISFENEYSSDFSPIQNTAISNKDYYKEYYQRLSTNYQIQKQFATINKQDSVDRIIGNSIFYGESDSTYFLKKYIDLPSLEDFFNEIVENVQVKQKKDNYEIIINSSNNQLILPPLLLVDGVLVFNNSKFLKIPANEIEKIDIINSTYILGEMKYGGIISLFSKNKNLANISSSSSFTFYQFDGPSISNKFTNIDYSKEEMMESRIPDFRNTLYWNPSIVTNERDKVEISFYTSDELGKYLITVEGFSSNGQAISKQLIIEVK